MISEEKDAMRKLFAMMPDEHMPAGFNERVMAKVRQEALARKKRSKRWEIIGYASGFVAMTAFCVLAYHYMDMSFEMPEMEIFTFTKPEPEIFSSHRFMFSTYIGAAALILLIADTTIRNRIEKAKHK